MPELPEVETTRRCIEPQIIDQIITGVIVRQQQLRWLVPKNLAKKLINQKIISVTRRAKYLLLKTELGTLIIHLGMSGSLQIATTEPNKHDHVDVIFANKICLRFNDPRRFGCVLWTEDNPLQHKLLADLGVEPLTHEFDGEYLYQHAQKRRIAVKGFIMDSHVVVGVGNIYANETLFDAGINPLLPANKISKKRYQLLVKSIKNTLINSIENCGTTLRDFRFGNGSKGEFASQLKVYGHAGEPCPNCGSKIRSTRIGQRNTFYCPKCQK